MFDLFTAIDEINKSIFRHNKVESGNRDPRDPLRESPKPPLKDSPKINPDNEVFDFFSTIFNLCSVERRRKNITKTREPQSPPTQAEAKKLGSKLKEERQRQLINTNNVFVGQNLPDTAVRKQEIESEILESQILEQENKKDLRLYKIYDKNENYFACARLSSDDFRYDVTNSTSFYKIKLYYDDLYEDSRPRSVIILKELVPKMIVKHCDVTIA